MRELVVDGPDLAAITGPLLIAWRNLARAVRGAPSPAARCRARRRGLQLMTVPGVGPVLGLAYAPRSTCPVASQAPRRSVLSSA